MNLLRLTLTLTFVLSLAGCSESHGAGDPVPDDADMLADGSVDATVDGGGGPVDGGGGTVDSGITIVDGGGGATDGGTGTPDTGVVVVDPPDAGGVSDGSTPGVITCGDTTCEAASQQCCISGGGGGASSMCIPIGDACMGAAVDCDGPEDCSGGTVCCANGGFGGDITVACVDSSMCTGGFGGGFELCHGASDCTDTSVMCCPIMAGGISGAFCSARCFGGGGF